MIKINEQTLLDALTLEDRENIEHYVSLFGASIKFIGVDKYLTYWAKNKVKLYKLLGNSLTLSQKISFSIPEEEKNDLFINLYERSKFLGAFEKWYWNDISFSHTTINMLGEFVKIRHMNFNTMSCDLIFERENKKPLKITAGTKYIRAFRKVLEYYKDSIEEKYPNIFELFEEFRIEHSTITNTEIKNAELVFSIHPLDFMTMSDNDCNWSSCMNWRSTGCYRIGTVEMMNSNNVICCYLKRDKSFQFDKKDPKYAVPNKMWRQLFYVTKDIIVSGKSYPYGNEEITKKILEQLRELAQRNLNWNYRYGPEPYRDMIHIYGKKGINKMKEFTQEKRSNEHSIFFESQGMYNDMFNDKFRTYWCVRNKVKHSKIISYSGKTNCLCCNKKVITFEPGRTYNERYVNTENVVCEECIDQYFTCDICHEQNTIGKHYVYNTEDGDLCLICERCFISCVKLCPVCHEPILVYNQTSSIYVPFVENYSEQEIKKYKAGWNSLYRGPYPGENTVFPLILHKECTEQLGVPLTKHEIDTGGEWYYNRQLHGTVYYTVPVPEPAENEKLWYPHFGHLNSKENSEIMPSVFEVYKDFYFKNLQNVEPEDGLVLRENF